MKNILIVGVGVAAFGGLVYFLSKNKMQPMLEPATAQNVIDTGSSQPVASSAQAAPKQTMWKDRDGDIYQITGQYHKNGYVIKINGNVPEKGNQMETIFMGPEGYVMGVDRNGSAYVWKNKNYTKLIKDNKTEADAFLAKHGQPKIFQTVSGLGCYLMT